MVQQLLVLNSDIHCVEMCWDPPSESEDRATAIHNHYRHSIDTMLLLCLAHLNEPHSVHAVSRTENLLKGISKDC